MPFWPALRIGGRVWTKRCAFIAANAPNRLLTHVEGQRKRPAVERLLAVAFVTGKPCELHSLRMRVEHPNTALARVDRINVAAKLQVAGECFVIEIVLENVGRVLRERAQIVQKLLGVSFEVIPMAADDSSKRSASVL